MGIENTKLLIAKRKELQETLASINSTIESNQRNCKHDFSPVKYDPDTKREPYGYELVGQGSDVYYEPTGYKDVNYPRWSRTCNVCGKVEYTNKTRSVGTEPDFNS